ncbi:MAG: hypothetical protein JO079_14680 [Frankiaceae bacterium]|nr:hypothetical protein [Frankiaceae bacterium]MBV9369477.1 hypothetical protein [Frankiales bacterium]
MTATINWRHHVDGKNVDGATLPSGTGVRLTSRRHLQPPSEYEVYRVIPKPFWRFWGAAELLETRLEAVPNSLGEVGGWHSSADVWHLPEPLNASGTVTFHARADTRDGQSGRLSSARLWLDEIKQHRTITGEATARIALPGVELGPRGRSEGGVERSWRVQVATDPWISISLLQGPEVAEHLASLEQDYSGLFDAMPAPVMTDLPPDTATYFVDRPVNEATATVRIEPHEGATVRVAIPNRRDLRAAICLSVTDLDSGERFVSDPVFITSIRDRTITTDMTFDMLSEAGREVLQMFDEMSLDVFALAERLGLSAPATWQSLVSAADELGADSITDAASFAALAAPALA